LSSSSSSDQTSKASWKSLLRGPPKCKHGYVCVKRVVKKGGPNFKKQFWSCPILPAEELVKGPKCQFFQWMS
jgi:hypothetical protein